MPNHFHLIINPHSTGNISLFMKLLGERYVRYFNNKYDRTGTLWESRFRETNPVRAGLVKAPEFYQ